MIGNGETLVLGVFDGFTGGARKAESTKHRDGGMGKQRSLGGFGSRDDFNVSRLYDLLRDHPYFHRLDAMVGIGIVSAVRQKLNTDRSPAGAPIGYSGVLMGYTPADHDSDSAEKAMFTLEVSADEAIS